MTKVDADVIGFCETDAWTGEQYESMKKLTTYMTRDGYDFVNYDQVNKKSGCAIFYKRDKLTLFKSEM